MTDNPPLHVAIVGGGLCGVALAIALEKRNVPYTIYEARASFTELGAGLNLGPNAIRALNAIDPDLHDRVEAIATRNVSGKEPVWMDIRLGAPTEVFEDAHCIGELQAAPSGNMTFSRNELLQVLAETIPKDRAKFNKKVESIQQSSTSATLMFDDGTVEQASVVIGCDGVHSTVREQMEVASEAPSIPRFSHSGGYRAVFSMEAHESAVGPDKAHTSNIWCGPGGYVVMYPIDGAKNVNIGLWVTRRQSWEEESWVLRHQKAQMLEDFREWGGTIQKVMSMMSVETEFWASFHHDTHPQHYFNGRIGYIGDAAHAMPPHQGQGASQAMEDACVMADVLQRANELGGITEYIEAAFLGFEFARKQRFEDVRRTSAEAHAFWSDLWRRGLTAEELQQFHNTAYARLEWIWNEDIAGQQRNALAEMNRLVQAV